MKKLGIFIFTAAAVSGIVAANLASFGKISWPALSLPYRSTIVGSGNAATETRNLGNFRAVEAGGVFRVEIAAGKDYGVRIDADDNLLPYIETTVDDGVLTIKSKERLNSRLPIAIWISAPSIERIDADGAAQFALRGVNNVTLDIDAGGAARVFAAGESAELAVEAGGSAIVEAGSLAAKNADVDVSGAASVQLAVSEELTAEASGAARVTYLGDPKTVEKNTSGAGTVERLLD